MQHPTKLSQHEDGDSAKSKSCEEGYTGTSRSPPLPIITDGNIQTQTANISMYSGVVLFVRGCYVCPTYCFRCTGCCGFVVVQAGRFCLSLKFTVNQIRHTHPHIKPPLYNIQNTSPMVHSITTTTHAHVKKDTAILYT